MAKILRKGLWAESNKGDEDWQLALKHYLEALQECDEVGVDHLSDEYTGIQLKVVEMYEHLGMKNEAASVLDEIDNLYLSVLRAPPGSAEAKRIKSRAHRSHLVQKLLRVAIKYASFRDHNPQVIKSYLLAHVICAQDEINKKKAAPEAAEIAKKQDVQIPGVESNPDAYHPFAEEYFAICDLLSVVSLQARDINVALWARVKLIHDMILARASPEKTLLAQCNLASLFYIFLEQNEVKASEHEKHVAKEIGWPLEKVQAVAMRDPSVPEKEKEEIEKAYEKFNEGKFKLQTPRDNVETLAKTVMEKFNSVIIGWKNLPAEYQTQGTTETAAIATYGIGVVNLHMGNYDEAERYLREARVRSRKCQYEVLIGEIERELEKLKEERSKAKPRRVSLTLSPEDVLAETQGLDDISPAANEPGK